MHHETPASTCRSGAGGSAAGTAYTANSMEPKIFLRLALLCLHSFPSCLPTHYSRTLPAFLLSQQRGRDHGGPTTLSKPPEISDELWTLELPSILGTAHSSFPDSSELPPSRAVRRRL